MSNPLKILIASVVVVSVLSIVVGLNVSQPVTSVSDDYDFAKPDATIKLPGKLREISGIAWWGEHEVVAVQDEDGDVFVIDLKQGEVKTRKKFRKDGDYEDIAVVNDHIYVLRNDGDLFKISNFLTKKQDTDKIETWLTDDHDTEGLCYDVFNDQLLVLCKEGSGHSGKRTGQRDIYAYDILNERLSEDPMFSVSEQQVHAFYQENYKDAPVGHFKPSALAIHPMTKEYYLVSSAMKTLVVVDQNGALKTIYRLPPALFKQPEGLAFDPQGNLYISNEGKKGKGRIHRFNYTP